MRDRCWNLTRSQVKANLFCLAVLCDKTSRRASMEANRKARYMAHTVCFAVLGVG